MGVDLKVAMGRGMTTVGNVLGGWQQAGNAAWAIGNLCRDEGWCKKMLERVEWVEEVIAGIVRLLQTPDHQTSCDAACALAFLAATPRWVRGGPPGVRARVFWCLALGPLHPIAIPQRRNRHGFVRYGWIRSTGGKKVVCPGLPRPGQGASTR